MLVPDRLKHRWSLHFGPQHQRLPRILDEHHPVDFFHYDSDKTYHGMIRTYRMQWPGLSTGGVLVSDDLNNDAFLDFADSQSVTPIVTIKPHGSARVGILERK